MVGQGAAVGVPVGVLSPLQDELLALEVVVLVAHPAGGRGGSHTGVRVQGSPAVNMTHAHMSGYRYIVV